MRRALTIITGALAAVLLMVVPAQASFGLSDFDVKVTDADGGTASQAGSHPFALTTFVGFNFTGVGTSAIVDGKARDLLFEQVAGLVGDLTAVPTCSTADFLADMPDNAVCPLGSVVGIQSASYANPDFFEDAGPIFLLPAPPGAAGRLGWKVNEVPIVVDLGIKQSPQYNALATSRSINQTLSVFGVIVELWGVPADPAHDLVRGNCAPAADVPSSLAAAKGGERIVPPADGLACPSSSDLRPFLTLPRSCDDAAITRYAARSWQQPDVWLSGEHVGLGFSGCGILDFAPTMAARPTTGSAETATGLDFSLGFDDEGLKSPDGLAQSEIRKAVVTMPEGVTVNPSVAEGLDVCTPADLVRESLAAQPGEGCPNGSKIGTVNVVSPLVDESVEGSVFIAQQDDPATTAPGAENPFDSLIAFYIVLKSPSLGILVKQAAKVEPDPRTGQLVTTVEDIPQIPFSRFEFHFREGQRAPLVSPASCGTYTVTAELTPRAQPSNVLPLHSSFQILSGPEGRSCPAGGVPPFSPGFEAGALNNNAKSFSPFLMRLTRRDGDQDLTKFSAVLPPGVLGKLAGVGKCGETRIAAAKAKTGRQELATPSCPATSRIGGTEAGAGVGSALTFVPGSLYLAGPYKGAPLSVVAITPAVAGPFDAGTVVVRVALTLNPKTAEVEVDGAASDPIPHILKGIVLKLRELEVNVDRRNFTLNPTSCDPSSTRATVFGSFLDVFSPSDDVAVRRTARHQVANCSRLPFKPRLSLRLKGGTKRGGHPSLRAVLKPGADDANIERIVTRLPRSAFLDQAHIRTICTRVQFAADACPAGAIYGRAAVFTPLLDEPLRGPVYLRSSNNKLPDLVVDLHGIVDIETSARIDSKNGGIRATFTAIPDGPISKAVLNMRGGRKGLIVNSRNLCVRRSRAEVTFAGHNGKQHELRPTLGVRCGKNRKTK